MNNLNCIKDHEFYEAGTKFNPLENLHKYSNPDVILKLVTGIKEGKYRDRFDSGHKRPNPAVMEIFDALYFINTETIDGWDLFYR